MEAKRQDIRRRIQEGFDSGEKIRGELHYRWRGGRARKDNGYIVVTVHGEYPFPESLSARRRIYEHRMVMELHLGRALGSGEVVHHLNGDSADNRIENLALHGSHADHMAEHGARGDWMRRWPACVFGCGRQAKSYCGRRWHACARCRRLAANRNDPRIHLHD